MACRASSYLKQGGQRFSFACPVSYMWHSSGSRVKSDPNSSEVMGVGFVIPTYRTRSFSVGGVAQLTGSERLMKVDIFG